MIDPHDVLRRLLLHLLATAARVSVVVACLALILWWLYR